MKTTIAGGVCVLLASGAVPARADFKYTDTSTITGGSLKGMMKMAGIFSKQASQAMKPTSTTHYLKGNRMRSDSADAKIEIIDLDGRRIIEIDPQKHTYSEVTFDEMKAAIQKGMEQAQAQPQPSGKDAKPSDVNTKMNAKFTVTPGTASREIKGVTVNETKVQMDMEIQAQDKSQPSQQASGTISTTVDMWVAPSVAGYQEIAEFYQRMAKEINWVPPSGIQIDPRASQSMEEFQKNSANMKGFPMLEYMTMSMAGQQQGASTNTAQNGNSSNASSSDDNPTTPSAAMVKGLGSLFGKKKKQEDASDQNVPNSQNPPPPSTPGSLIEMTIEVTSYSDGALDAGLFDVPAGYTRVQANADQIVAPASRQGTK